LATITEKARIVGQRIKAENKDKLTSHHQLKHDIDRTSQLVQNDDLFAKSEISISLPRKD